MQIINKDINDLKEYENNPRDNSESIMKVANSIREFGFKVPIVIDKDNVIVAGHTRYRASLVLGLTEVPCIMVDTLSDEQIRLFRIVDNKSGEYSSWDYFLLDEELEKINNIDMEEFGFSEESLDWDSIEEIGEDNYEEPGAEEYQCPYCEHKDAKWRFMKVDV